jgi:hypothetical protein
MTPYEKSVVDRRAAARAQRSEGSSLADYGSREQIEWLGGVAVDPGAPLTVYRAMLVRGEIQPGDYVTNSRQYAQEHIENNLGGVGVIVDVIAHLDEIFPADGPKEFWYLPRSLDARSDAEPTHQIPPDPPKRIPRVR